MTVTLDLLADCVRCSFCPIRGSDGLQLEFLQGFFGALEDVIGFSGALRLL